MTQMPQIDRLIRLAGDYIAQGRYAEADFVTNRVLPAVASGERRAQNAQPTSQMTPASGANFPQPDMGDDLMSGTLGSKGAGNAWNNTGNWLSTSVDKIFGNESNSVAAFRDNVIRVYQNLQTNIYIDQSAKRQISNFLLQVTQIVEQQSPQTHAGRYLHMVRVANMSNMDGVRRTLDNLTDYADQVFKNLNKKLWEQITTILNQAKQWATDSPVNNSGNVGVRTTGGVNQNVTAEDWFASPAGLHSNITDLVTRVRKWIANQRRTQPQSTPDYISRLRSHGVPEIVIRQVTENIGEA